MLSSSIFFLATTMLTVCVRAGPILRNDNSTLHDYDWDDSSSPHLFGRAPDKRKTGRHIVQALQEGIDVEKLLGDNNLRLKEPEKIPLVNSVMGTFDSASAKILDSTMGKLKDKLRLFQEYEISPMAIKKQRNAPWGIHRVYATTPSAINDGGPTKDYKSLSYDYQYEDSAGDCATVYIVDTGVNEKHSEFDNKRVTWGKVFVKKSENSKQVDLNGHGTQIAIVGGEKFGIAKKANMIAVKVGNEATFRGGDLIKALDWIHEQHRKQTNPKPTIVNLSVGTDSPCDLTDLAAKKLTEKGIYVVAAAGNDGKSGSEHSPGRVPEVIAVGASSFADTMWRKSSHGPTVDIFAPGEKIPAADFRDRKGNTASKPDSGTSLAAAHVSGLIAYLTCLKTNPVRDLPAAMGQRLQQLAYADNQYVLGNMPAGTKNYLLHMPKPQN